MSAVPGREQPRPGGLARRLRPLQAGAGLQGLMLWVPVEKLFQTQIGFDAAAIAVMAAAYAAVVPLLEVPSGILADRWSRSGILIISSAAASALIGGLSHNVATYIVAALILGVYFAMNSGTVDSVVYDTVIEETGSADTYERWIGRVRVVESAAFTTSARRLLLLAALAALLSQAVFEFGPLWLVALHAPAAAFGPYWAVLVATLGAGGYLAARLHLGRRSTALAVAAVLAGTPILLATSHAVVAVAAAQTVLQLALAVTGIYAGRLLHDAVPSHIRAGVSSGAGTFSWMLFLPFSLGFGALARSHGVYTAGWITVGTSAALATLLILSARAARAAPAEVEALEALAAATGDEALGGDPRPLLTPPPDDLACRDLVRLVSDYLDGDLPPDWRASIDDHLSACDGCTAYLEQIRQTVDDLREEAADLIERTLRDWRLRLSRSGSPRRAQPVGQHGEDQLAQGRVGAARQAGEHALQQHDEVGCPDSGADRARLLGAAQQQVQRREQILAQRAGDRDGIGQVTLGCGLLGDPGEVAEERLARIGGAGPGAGVRDQVLDTCRDHRLEQRLLGREVPVDGAGPDSGAGRDLVERHAVAGFGERLPGGAQHLLPVPRRIGAQRAIRRHPIRRHPIRRHPIRWHPVRWHPVRWHPVRRITHDC